MNCEFCNLPFNLSSKVPLMLPCCGSTACKECIINQAGEPQSRVFTCPFKDCGQKNQDQSTLKTNRHLEKVLKQSIGILCDLHPQNFGEFYCTEDKMFVCAACIVGNHKSHTCNPVDKQEIINYNNNLLEFLKIEFERIKQLIDDIEAYQSNDVHFTSLQYQKIIREAQEILNPRQHVEEQSSMKKKPLQNSNQQEEQKNPEKSQSQIVEKEKINIKSKLLTWEDYSLIKKYLNTNKIQMELLYRGSDHGFNISKFHDLCDNKGPTLTIALSNHNQLIGGYTSLSWESKDQVQWKEDSQAFLFSLTKKYKLTQYQNKDKAVRHYSFWGPCFGGGTDLGIGCLQSFDSDYSCWSNCHETLKRTYGLPNSIYNHAEEAKKYLGGAQKFKLKEIEIFKVILN